MFIDQSKKLPFPKVTPIRLTSIVELAKKFSKKENFEWGIEYNKKILIEMERIYRDWYSPLIELDKFPYVYFMNNGITQALEYLSIYYKNREIKMLVGDYFWLKLCNAATEVKEVISCDISYQSNPSTIDGNIHNTVWNSKLHILDGAYIGTSTKKTPVPNNTEIILLGFGKNIGLPELRLGLIFSKHKIPILDAFQKIFGHVGLAGFKIVADICKEVPILELAHSLKKSQELYCNTYFSNTLIPSDSALLSTTSDTNFNFYKRPNGIIRVPLGESITEFINYQNTLEDH